MTEMDSCVYSFLGPATTVYTKCKALTQELYARGDKPLITNVHIFLDAELKQQSVITVVFIVHFSSCFLGRISICHLFTGCFRNVKAN